MSEALSLLSPLLSAISALVAAVWFVARLKAEVLEAVERGDRETAAELRAVIDKEIAEVDRTRGHDKANATQALAGVLADVKDLQRTSASRDELKAVEGRIGNVLARIEGKLDSMGERTAAVAHLTDSIRGLTERFDRLESRMRSPGA